MCISINHSVRVVAGVLALATAASADQLRAANIMNGVTVSASQAAFHYAAGKDLTLLTDGKTAEALDPKTVVGWEFAGQIVLTSDFGQSKPIDSISLHTLVNPASGAQAAEKVIAFVSEDGKTYREVGEVPRSENPDKAAAADGNYRPVVYQLTGIGTNARYVKVVVIPRGLSFFASELAIGTGPEGSGKTYPEVANLETHILKTSTELHAGRRVSDDYKSARAAVLDKVNRGELSDEARKEIYQKIKSVGSLASRETVAVTDPLAFRAVVPLSDAHRQAYALYGLLAEKEGRPALEVSTPNRWDPLKPNILEEAARPSRDLRISAFRGETRSDAFVIGNASAQPKKIEIALEGAAGSLGSQVSAFGTEWTDTKKGALVASSLMPLEKHDGVWTVEVPAGMTRMIWLQFSPQVSDESSDWTGAVKVTSAGKSQEIPLKLKVHQGDWPGQVSLHSGGWDYLAEAIGHKPSLGLAGAEPTLPESLKSFLEANATDTPWAAAILPYGRYDEAGNMIEKPSVEAFDRWIAFWPNARRYAIFNNSLTEIDGKPMGTPAFDRAVQEWSKFWSDHIASLDLKKDVILLLVDEPGMHEGQVERSVAWSSAIRKSGGIFKLWTNSVFKNPQKEADKALWDAMDIVCPLRTQMLEYGPEFTAFFREMGREGKTLELYSCDGPAFELDPYTYFRLQAWSALSIGAVASSFWQFSNLSEMGLSWNEYINNYISYAPFFLGKDGVHTARQMEALKDGVQDYEYYQMLTSLVAKAKAANMDGPEVAQAELLLKKAVETVLDAQGASSTKWDVSKDRAVADAIVEEMGESISKLTKGMVKNATASN